MLTFRNVNIISIILFLVVLLLQYIIRYSIWWLISPFILWLIITTIGSFHIKWNYFLKSNHKNYNTNQNVIALTFDDGPNSNFTPRILDLLEKYNAKATFFCIGKQVKKNPKIIKQIILKGHLIGNHSYAHSNNYGFLSTQSLINDMNLANDIIKEATELNVRFFRPPFGVTNPNIAKAIKKLKLESFGWSIRSLDTTNIKTNKIFQKISSKLQKGDVILLHDTSDRTIFLLEQLLQYLHKKEMRSVTLSELFNYKAYED